MTKPWDGLFRPFSAEGGRSLGGWHVQAMFVRMRQFPFVCLSFSSSGRVHVHLSSAAGAVASSVSAAGF
jgi:hypothetical protein